MIRPNFAFAFRSFWKEKYYTLLNIAGLSIGLCSTLLICVFIVDEQTYDSFHPEVENLHVLGAQGKIDGRQQATVMAPGAWVPSLQNDFSEVKAATQTLSPGFPASFRNPETDLITVSEQFLCVSPGFKNVFQFDLVHGEKEHVFHRPNSVVLSASTADRLFGDENPLGKTLGIKHIFLSPNKYEPLIVTGVIQDYPTNSHIQPDYLLTLDFFKKSLPPSQPDWQKNWGADYGWFTSYVRTNNGVDPSRLAQLFGKVVETRIPEGVDRLTKPFLLPLEDLHFDDELNIGGIPRFNIKYLYIMGCTAVLILLMAAINYTNLATARAQRRAKEIGLRKVMGGSRWQLISQFLYESFLITFAALLVALALAVILLPFFNTLSGRYFTLSHLMEVKMVFGFLCITVLLSLCAGCYPALYLSGLRPLAAIRNARLTGKGTGSLRKGLIVVQYAVTLLLIVSTGVIMKQMDLIRSSSLSLDSDQMLSIRWGKVAPLSKYHIFKQLIQEDPEIRIVAMGKHLPFQDYFGTLNHQIDFPALGGEPFEWSALYGDFDFPRAFQLDLIAGRTFEKGNPADSNAFLLNESALKALDLSKEEVLGLTMQTIPSWAGSKKKKTGTVIGIVQDFPYRSIHHRIDPLVISSRPDPLDRIVYVKLPSGQYQEKIAHLEKAWKHLLSEDAFEYWFMSDEFATMYETEIRLSNISKSFSVLSIVIACIGLFGLASYVSGRRSREIAVRKVLGARVSEILGLLFSTFMVLFFVACLVALPVTWLVLDSWLQDFSYRVEIDPIIFLLSMSLVILLTLATVCYETVRAAIANPVDSLRND